MSHLPGSHKPEVLGLHPNAAIGYSVRFARNLWSSLLMLLPETESVGGIPSAQRMNQVAASANPQASAGEQQGSSSVTDNQMRRASIRSQPDQSDAGTVDVSGRTNQDVVTSTTDTDQGGGSGTRGGRGTSDGLPTDQSSGHAAESVDAGIGYDNSDDDDYDDDSEDLDREEEMSELGGRRRAMSVSISLSGRPSMLPGVETSSGAGAVTGASSSRELMIGRMADSLLNRLPPLFDVDGLRKKHMGTEISPTIVVLMQELDRYNNKPVFSGCNYPIFKQLVTCNFTQLLNCRGCRLSLLQLYFFTSRHNENTP